MKKTRASMGFTIVFSFIIVNIITFIILEYIVFSGWKASTDDIITKIEYDATADILYRIETFFDVALSINEANHYMIENGVVNTNDIKKRDIFFAGVIKINRPEIYSFTYGNEAGEYYGARRADNNGIEIVKNNSATNGKSRYYSVNNDLTAGNLVMETNKFDVRTRDWYKIAKEKGKPVFSPIYKHFLMNDLTISAAYPIYSKNGKFQGVLGTHIILSKINSFLQDAVKDKNAIAYILEKSTGNLVANSLNEPNFKLLSDNSIERVSIEGIHNEAIANAYRNYKNDSGGNYRYNRYVNKSDMEHINITEYKQAGLNWLIITSVSKGQYSNEITEYIKIVIGLSVLALVIAVLIYTKCTELVLNPVYNLIDVTRKFAKGDFLQRATIYRNDEIGILSEAFNKMAEEINSFINTLDQKVKDRTKELEKANREIEAAKDAAEHLATHDFLTGLPNRMLFMDRIEAEISRADRNNSSIVVMSIDLDKFKEINDTLGHTAGDCVLTEITDKLKKVLRGSDTLCRIGGDEFILLSSEIKSAEDAEIIALRIIDAVNKPFECINGNVVSPSFSIGIALYPQHGKDPKELVINSDIALYKAKKNGRNRYEFFKDE